MTCNILFICTGNIFRSMSAEYILIKLLKDNKDKRFSVASAGIGAKPQKMHRAVKSTLKEYGITPKHTQRKVTKAMLDEADMVICMARNHHNYLKKHFGVDAIFFNEFATGKKRSLRDANEQKTNWDTYIPKVVRFINDSMPRVYEQLVYRNFLFDDFATGKRKKHYNNILFKKLTENNHSLAFLSIDIPRGKHSHALVIPKKRFKNFEDIPSPMLKDMMQLTQRVGRAFKQEYPAYNILLNNGAEAGQYINHAHVHIVPRAADDNIQIEVWHHNHVTEKRYVEQVHHFKKLLAKTK